MNLKDIVQQLANFTGGNVSVQDVGVTCVLPECKTPTLGVRCEKCARILCVKHTFWNITLKHATPYCPYCIVVGNPELFQDADDEVNDDKKDGGGADGADVIDAEIVDD